MATKNEETKISDDVSVETIRKELQTKNEECEILRAKVARMELDLVEARMFASQHQTEYSEVHKMKEESEELLTKAKSIIFEKVKMCKNQELQIEALSAQVTSLKDVVSITKNLLEIRNMEVTHLQDQINAMNGKMEAEKERQTLIHSKLEKMIRMNADLKREYETQLVLFNALRDRYTERELAKGVVENLANKNAKSVGAGEPSTPVETKTTEVNGVVVNDKTNDVSTEAKAT